jgi:hypothetical protein
MLRHDSASAHTSLLVCEYLTKHDSCRPPITVFSRVGSCKLLFVPEVEICSEWSPISDDGTCSVSRRMRSRSENPAGIGVCAVEGSTLKEATSLVKL